MCLFQTNDGLNEMTTVNAILPILIFIALHVALLMAAALFMKGTSTAAVQSDTALDALRYQGVLYIGRNDKAVDCYRHCGTNAVYYKIGVQFRNATTGRIVSTTAAMAGQY